MWIRSGVLGVVLILVGLCGMVSGASVMLGWDQYVQGTDPAVGLNMYRGNGACPADVSLLTVSKLNTSGLIAVTTITYTDSNVALTKVYCYYATAVDAAGIESVPSNAVTFQLPQPAPPTGLSGKVGP